MKKFAILIAVALTCVQVTLVLCDSDDYGFFNSEESTTSFDETVRTTTARRTSARITTPRSTQLPTRRSSANENSRTTTSDPVTTTPGADLLRRMEGSESATQTVLATATQQRVQEDRVIWEKGQVWSIADCGSNKKCVSTYLCDKEGAVNHDGSFLIDERFDSGITPEVFPECPSLYVCCEKYNSLGKKPHSCDSFSAPPQCGVRNLQGLGGSSRSKQGHVDYASYAEFPWMMAVLNETNFLGGGSLIHPKVVVTAAHITADSDIKSLKVRGGEYDTQSTGEICPHFERKVENRLMHEQFVRGNLRNNLALLVLTKEFEMTATINTICLPYQDQSFENQNCVSGGWGKTNFGAIDRYQAFLKKVDLPVVPNDRCEEMMRKTRLGVDFVLHDSFLCAGGEEGKDVCTGDGGAPLMCPTSSNRNIYVLAAVVSGGIGCGEKDIPGFYTDVAKNRGWIDSKFRVLGIEIDNITPRRDN